MESDRLRIAVLVSGHGSNLQAILDACARPEFPARVVVVVSDRPGAYALERARRAGIPTHVVDWSLYRARGPFCRAMERVLEPYRVDLICLAGFLRILDAAFVAAYRGRILNIHPSLLPAFGGKGMYGERVHRAVLASGASVSGCTVHLVTEEVDAGPIVLQAEVPVLPGDTPERLAARVAEAEHRIYPEAIRRVALALARTEDLAVRRG